MYVRTSPLIDKLVIDQELITGVSAVLAKCFDCLDI